jgi:hypothetical protein
MSNPNTRPETVVLHAGWRADRLLRFGAELVFDRALTKSAYRLRGLIHF